MCNINIQSWECQRRHNKQLRASLHGFPRQLSFVGRRISRCGHRQADHNWWRLAVDNHLEENVVLNHVDAHWYDPDWSEIWRWKLGQAGSHCRWYKIQRSDRRSVWTRLQILACGFGDERWSGRDAACSGCDLNAPTPHHPAPPRQSCWPCMKSIIFSLNGSTWRAHIKTGWSHMAQNSF